MTSFGAFSAFLDLGGENGFGSDKGGGSSEGSLTSDTLYLEKHPLSPLLQLVERTEVTTLNTHPATVTKAVVRRKSNSLSLSPVWGDATGPGRGDSGALG